VQTAVGLVCVALGCVHFLSRDRAPQTRSFYLGATTSSPLLRATLALIELGCGFALLFLA
jgi:hypothetical protein